ncbi:MAG TPA: histidine kinase dimerization/phospho-acceptor domain-containing protein, partial [Desulfosporosinus sp.]|nr:histidine kinase dimerization/phospho-acceptor domain-containing protein [Desulfosporosinus sp.]
MRWSIKYKLPLMSLLLFLLVGLSMLSYQHFFILGSGRQSLQTNQENLDRISIEVSRGISDRYPHLDQIIEYIKGTAQTQSINISVYELNKEIVFQAKYQNDENDRNDRNDQNNQMFRIKSHDIVFANGKATYLVEIENSFGVKEILGLSIVENFVFFTLTVLSIILLWLVVYLHYDIVKPLSLLQKSFGLVGYSKNQLSFLPQKRNDEIGDLSAGFEKMVMNLGDSYNQQLEMISSISHDLKTPLTSIMGYIERLLISNIKTEEKKREYYQIIYQKAEDI